MNNDYDAIVIGSGLGGLTAGALYSQFGKRVLVLERHIRFGGAATVFRRKGLQIEVGLHELDGLDEGDAKLGLFKKLGLKECLVLKDMDSFFAVRRDNWQNEFVMPEGVEAAIDALIIRFPQHEKGIRKYFKVLCCARKKLNVYAKSNKNYLWWILNGPIFIFRFWPLIRYEKVTVSRFLNRLFDNDEDIKLALIANYSYYTDDLNHISLLFFAVAQGSYHIGGAYYIKGGSQELSNKLISIIKSNGGEAISRRLVKKIIVENRRAIGVEHEKAPLMAKNNTIKDVDSCKVYAPVIFGNAAPMELGKMIPLQYRSEFENSYNNLSLSISLWTIYLGFNRPPGDFGVQHYSTFIFPDWLTSIDEAPQATILMGSEPADRIPPFVFVDYNKIDSGLTKKGYFFGVICGADNIDNWNKLDEEQYIKAKGCWMNKLILALEDQFPGISEAIVYKEMATARTVKKYLNTTNGAVYGYAQDILQSGRFRPKSKTLIEGLWLASAFSFPGGGFTGAMLSGENAVKELMGKRYYSGRC